MKAKTPPRYIHISADLRIVKVDGIRRTLVGKGKTLVKSAPVKLPAGMTKKAARRQRIKQGHELRRWQSEQS